MRAAVYHGPGDVRIESVPEPGPPRPGELVVEVCDGYRMLRLASETGMPDTTSRGT